MRELDRIREELKADEATLTDSPIEPSDLGIDGDLAYALAQLEPSDALIEILMEMPINSSYEASSATVTAVLDKSIEDQPVIDFVHLRSGHGLTSKNAAEILDVSPMTLERLESNADMGWLNLSPMRVRKYLDQLGISPSEVTRAIAARMPQGPQFAYGYRPRMVAEEPLVIDEAGNDRERLVAWAHELYRA
jgi:transcriptional regulator with XRE-family HTH domain